MEITIKYFFYIKNYGEHYNYYINTGALRFPKNQNL